MENKIIKHQFANTDFYLPYWKIKHLLIGTFNPEGGEKVNYHYGRVKNQTWPTLSYIFNCQFSPNEKTTFFQLLEGHQIVCIDLIDEVHCPIDRVDKVFGKGYKDTAIINNTVKRKYNTNAILKIIENNPGINVYSTWGKGVSLQDWQLEINKLGKITALVSPSLAARVPKGTEKISYIIDDWKRKIHVG